MEASLKAAIITGAASGIGTAIAKHVAEPGFAVIVNYSTNQEAALAIGAEITPQSGTA